MNLYRGKNYGVFAGSDGYYVGQMAPDGVSHYQDRGSGCPKREQPREHDAVRLHQGSRSGVVGSSLSETPLP